MVIEECIKCNGNGWNKNVPCVNCNTRGRISDKLFDNELKNYPPKERHVNV